MASILQVSTAKFPAFTALQYGDVTARATIVLLHGFPADSSLWREAAPLLAQNYRLIVPDLPGVGNSTFDGEALSMDALAEGIAALLQAQGIKQAIVAGHSMGGYIALAFAARFPEMTMGLSIIHSTAKADDEEKVKTRRRSIELIRKGGREAFIRSMVPPLFAASFQREHPGQVDQQLSQALDVPERTLVAFYNAMIDRHDHTGTLNGAPFPVQWIIGSEDPLSPPEKVLQQTTLANVNFVSIYQQSAHMSMLEHPHRLASDVGELAAYCLTRQTQ